MKQLSILIPFYKGNNYINETISSIENVLKQVDYEIIIINDSPGVKIDLHREYKNLNIFINDKNTGIAESRNRAFDKSIGEYILFLDQDDMFDENCNIVQLLNLKKDLYIFNIYECVNGNKTLYYKHNPINFFERLNEKFLIKNGPIFKTVSQFLFKRTLFESFIKSEAQGADDFFFYCDLYKKTQKQNRLYVKKPQICYRLHPNNYSKSADFFASLNEIFEIWNKRNNNAYTKLKKCYFSKAFFWRFIHKLLCLCIIGR